MKNKFLRLISIFASCCIITVFTSTNELRAESDTGNRYVVIATNEDSVMLSIGCILYQDTFQKYSGEDFSLSYGDIVYVDNYTIDPIAPGVLVGDEGFEIKYLGTVADYYADSIKELTITEKSESGSHLKLKDLSGKSYTWFTQRDGIYYHGYKAEIDPYLLNVGDTINCAVETAEYYVGDTLNYREEVILPVTKLSENTTSTDASVELIKISGDANGDNKLNVSDCAFIARTLAKRETIDVTTNPAADYNNDGKVTVSDAATIARDLAKKGL